MQDLPERKRLKSLEHQEGGTHYQRFNIQPLEFLAMNRLPFIEGNIIKYVCRHQYKNGLEDLLKAKHYLEVLIETEYESARLDEQQPVKGFVCGSPSLPDNPDDYYSAVMRVVGESLESEESRDKARMRELLIRDTGRVPLAKELDEAVRQYRQYCKDTLEEDIRRFEEGLDDRSGTEVSASDS